ncbi:hypothetical protein M3J09_003887 [Ascochyta lentis]
MTSTSFVWICGSCTVVGCLTNGLMAWMSEYP